MKINPFHEKAWQRLCDEAAKSNTPLIEHAEQWAQQLETLQNFNYPLTAEAIYGVKPAECNTDDKAICAYGVLTIYWEHADLLIWKSLPDLQSAAAARNQTGFYISDHPTTRH